MTTRRLFCALAGAAALALGTAGTAAAQTQIRMWTFINPDGADPRGKVLGQLVKTFEERNPGLKVVVETQIWDQLSTKFLAAHGAGNAPDIAWVHNEQVAAALKVGALADINALFVNGWSQAERDDLDDAFFRYGATATERYVIAHSRNYFGLLYRPSMLQEAGLSAADLGTWDGLIAAAKKLTARDAGGAVTRWGFGQAFSTDKSTPQLAVNVMLARQGDLFEADGKAKWSTPVGVDAMNLQVDMARVHKITPEAAVSINAEELFELFTAGKYAIISASSVRVPVLQKALGSDDLAFAPWPGDKPGTHSPGSVTGWCTCLWSKSKNLAAASKFVEHMASREADVMWARDAGAVPNRKSTIETLKEAFAKPSMQYLAVAAQATAQYSWLAPLDFTIGGYREDLNKAAQAILARGTDTREALQAAERDFNRRHRR